MVSVGRRSRRPRHDYSIGLDVRGWRKKRDREGNRVKINGKNAIERAIIPYVECSRCGHRKKLEAGNKLRRVYLRARHPRYGARVPYFKRARIKR